MAVTKEQLDRAFNPRTVAVIGAKKSAGYNWLQHVRRVHGKAYSVHTNPESAREIADLGFENYASVLDIPDQIDYVIVCTPRSAAPQVIRECIRKGVGGVGMFSSGFAETKEPEGVRLQQEIVRLATEADLPLIGPNCMGLYNPRAGIKFMPEQVVGPEAAGPVTFVSQSGGHGATFATAALAAGLGINKIISFGNGATMESADYLEYFAGDSDTRVIAMYVEGVRDGRRFFDVLKRATLHKPVVVWKGWQTPIGQRATSSHTGSLAIPNDIWDAAIRQAGAVRADNLEEAVDAVKALLFLPPVTGRGAALIGGSGGQSVSVSDAFAKAGMDVPLFTEASYAKLRDFFRLVGASYMNPIDVGGGNQAQIQTIVDIALNDANIDILAVQVSAGRRRGLNPQQARETETLLEVLKKAAARTRKPIVAMLVSADIYKEADGMGELDRELREAGIRSFLTHERTARALYKLTDYHRRRAERLHDGEVTAQP
jgi:acyl-CoA synthetase (NDP forming)